MASALLDLLDGEYADTRRRVRARLARPEMGSGHGLPTGEYRERVLEQARAVAETGDATLGYPPDLGGRGDVGASIAAFETLGHGDLSLMVKIGVQFGLFGGAVQHLGTERHHAILRQIGTLELPGCFAMTETGHGSNVQALRTTATYDHAARELEIHTPDDGARKDYIGNAACHGRMAVVFCQLVVLDEPRGVHAVLVPLRDDAGQPLPGIRIEDCGEKLGLNGVDNGRIWFDHVRVPRDNLLDRYAQITDDGAYFSEIENPDRRFFTMLGTLVQGRVSVGGAAIAATRSALTIAVRYALARRQFGPPDSTEEIQLLDYRTHQLRLLPALATTYALHAAQQRLIARLHRALTEPDHPERDQRELETHAAGVKAVATWHATETIQACREACGGAGYLAESRFAALKADTDVFTTFEGDNTVLLQLVAKALLTDYRDHFGELDPLGVAAFFANQVIERIVERTAVGELVGRLADDLIPGRDESEDLLEREAQLGLFRFRAEHVLEGLARRLKAGIDDGLAPFEVLLDAQDHAVNAARAHVDWLVLQAFAEDVAAVENEQLRGLLERLCSLYALWNIQRDRAWFQEHGRISSTRSKAVLRVVNTLCGELRPHAAELVDAFDIPDELLGPLGARA